MNLPTMTRAEGKRQNYVGTCRDHMLHISRESRQSDWYIWVYAPSGALAYDGYWRNSAGKTIKAATAEAIRGAKI